MSLRYAVPLRLRSLFRRSQTDQDLADELRFHLEEKIQLLCDGGMSLADATRQAQRDFGNVPLHAEACRDQRGWNWLDSLAKDVQYSARALRRSPGFSATAILSLALGIGATTAIFSVFDVAVLHPLPAASEHRLVWFREYGRDHQESGGNPARLANWQAAHSFTAVAGFYSEQVVASAKGDKLRLNGVRYSGKFPDLLSAQLDRGRLPSVQEMRDGSAVLVLTAAAWNQLFHRDSNVVGSTLTLGGRPSRVIGVLSQTVHYPEATDFWAPMPLETQRVSREAGFLAQAGRLREGTSLAEAQLEMNALSERMSREYPATDKGRTLRLQSLEEHLSENSRRPLLLFLAIAFGVLIIACVNIAGLLLARNLQRQREISVRTALGAGRRRLVRLLLTESVLLTVAGCLAGVLLALGTLDYLKAVLPDDTPRLADASIQPRVLLFALLVSAVSALAFGAFPAFRAARPRMSISLKEGSAGSLGGVQTRLRAALVIVQVALSMALLTVGGLLLTSLLHLEEQPLGFRPAQAWSFTVLYPWDSASQEINRTATQILDRLSREPGMQAVGVVDRLPLHGGSQSRPLVVEGLNLSSPERERNFGWRTSSSDYFAAAGVPLVAGALFHPFAAHGPQECVISHHLATTLFGTADPIGHRIASRPRPGAAPDWFRITGVVGDTKLRPTDSEPAAELYVPWGFDYWPILNFVVRTDRPAVDVTREIVRVVRPLLTSAVIDDLQPLSTLTADTHTAYRTRALLAAILAAIALLLSGIGLFALLAHETARRTSEYGIRLALGANPHTLALDAVRRAFRITVPGILLGALAAILLGRLLQNLLFEVRSTDAWPSLGAGLLLLGTAAAASFLPARRTARVNPVDALRHE